jgi:DNA repair protein RadD
MPLRDYQAEAIASAYQFLRDNPGKNPCIVLPTGAGKTAVIATICRDAVENWGGRVLVVSHVKELVEQSAATLRSWYPSLDVGVYSAGVGRRDIDNAVIVAGIQSIHDKGLKLCGSKPFNLVLVDEAHRIPPDGEGQYQTLLNALKIANPKVRVIGLTATPYRTKGGWVCSDDHFLNEICYEVSVRQLIAQGYLSKLTSKHGQNDADLSGVSIQRGEFASGEMEEAFDAIVESAVDEIFYYGQSRKSVLIFCAGVEHAVKVAERLAAGGESVERLTGSTNKFDREKIVDDFKAGRTKYLCNVNVLTEGFDATGVDMVVLLRATLSPGLYYQMVGRGLRLHEGKENCLVLDFGGNVKRHGPIDDIRVKSPSVDGPGLPPAKECPECKEVVPISYSACPDCGYVFPEPEPTPRHEPRAGSDAILTTERVTIVAQVSEVHYSVHFKKGWQEGQPRTMRVDYYDGISKVGSEWVCIEHEGYAWQKAFSWWTARSNAKMPASVDDAVAIGNLDLIAKPNAIKVKTGGQFDEVVDYDYEGVELEEVDQDWLDNHLARVAEDDEVPF